MKGSNIEIVTDDAFQNDCTAEKLFVDYPNIVNILQPRSRIFIDDGLISLLVNCIGRYIY